MQKYLFVLLLLILANLTTKAQFDNQKRSVSKKKEHENAPRKYKRIYPDSALKALCVSLDIGAQLPTGNFYNRFGISKSVGITVYYKTKSRFLMGGGFDYYFGNNVKENNLFKNISTPDGNIITDDGGYAEIRLYERAYFVGPTFGYISKIVSSNKNSGLSFWLSAGFFEHRIKILGDNVTQLSSNYKVGYDRLSNGLGLRPSVYYYHMSRNHLVNYKIGIDFMAGFTKGQRNINFDTGLSGRDKRFDGMIGLKASWFIPKFFFGKNNEYTF
ncbi:MAG: hypothetical protein RIQ33_1423 [Bacteroidota bacterium]|jgi:hypothetical protein